ncbi:MAG: hypothetical protein H0T89_25100 [Deltaproteobacteria bacterium]|nr:hypothetical protein [Deltaproteobacteria bacterium]MDQ3299328.1 hypothetical protein [Myxococcota bacterium]
MHALLIATLLFMTACGDDGTSPPAAKWQLLGERLPSSLLATWAPSLDNVWVVGGREGVGLGPTVFHYDGTAWSKLETNEVDVDLWQVFGFADGTVFLGGSKGTILRYRDGVFTKLQTPSTDIVFGLWGSSSDDVWAVGGQTSSNAFVWRYRGTAFESVDGVPTELAQGTVWKVTGRAANDVWMSCSRGLILHWDGNTLTKEQVGTVEESLFSMGCGTERCVAVGTNLSTGVIHENAGQGWMLVPAEGPIWRGMTPTGDDSYVVGMSGGVVRRTDTGWVPDRHLLTTKPLHAAWADDDGNLFVVGGEFDRALTLDGVLLFKGSATLPPLP